MLKYAVPALILVGMLILWIDKRYYKRHPGVEKRYGDIDRELSSKGL